MNIAAISKAIGAVVGAIVAVAAVWGFGDGNTVFGLDQTTVVSVLTPIASFLGTYFAPANKT